MDKSKLGKPTGETQGTKDCIHVPIIAVLFEETPYAGMPVILSDDLKTGKFAGTLNPHGFVDPFLKVNNHGTTVWVLVSPEYASNLKHNFELQLPNQNNGKVVHYPEGLPLRSNVIVPLPMERANFNDDECRNCY